MVFQLNEALILSAFQIEGLIWIKLPLIWTITNSLFFAVS
jgi:hypothetical protein